MLLTPKTQRLSGLSDLFGLRLGTHFSGHGICKQEPRAAAPCRRIENGDDRAKKGSSLLMEPEAPSFYRVFEALRTDLGLLAEMTLGRRREFFERARIWIEGHPWGAVGAAFGLGYALSGALVSRSTLRLLSLGIRLYLRDRFVPVSADELNRRRRRQGGNGQENSTDHDIGG